MTRLSAAWNLTCRMVFFGVPFRKAVREAWRVTRGDDA